MRPHFSLHRCRFFILLIVSIVGCYSVPLFAGSGTSVSIVPGISTVVGTGTPGINTPPILATNASIQTVVGIAFDSSGNVYFADGNANKVYKIDISSGIMTLFAGKSGASGFSGDGGPATNAQFRGPGGIKFDRAGNLYIADTANNVIRMVSPSGIISTVVGAQSRAGGYSGDGGPATSAKLTDPNYMAFDSAGNLYISDSFNNAIRRVDAITHIITTYAGNGTSGFSGDGGPATSAQLDFPNGIAFDSADNLYICDRQNSAIRMVAAGTHIMTTVAGTGGSAGSSGDGGAATSAQLNLPWSVAVDSSNNLYISDSLDGVVRKVDASTHIVTTVVGSNGSQGYSGDGGPASEALLTLPSELAFDRWGRLYIGDILSPSIRAVTIQSIFPNTAVGSTSGSQTLLLHLTGTMTIRNITVPASQGGRTEFNVATLSGTGCAVGTQITAGAGLDCALPVTFSPLVPGPRYGAVVVYGNSTPPNVLATVHVSGTGVGPVIAFAPGTINTVAGNGTYGYSGDGSGATGAELGDPNGVALDGSGNVYLADAGKNVVRMVNTATGVITTVAGNGTAGYSGDGGAATSANLNGPNAVTLDASGNLYIADGGNNVIRMVNAATGTITTVAGNGTAGYNGDGGAATGAELNFPGGIAFDGSGNLYIPDQNNNVVRMVTPAGVIATVAGNKANGGSYAGDGGAATSASLNAPAGVAFDGSGNLYIADQNNMVIRMVNPAGVITTVAGNGSHGYSGDGGLATSAELFAPNDVKLDAAGNLYIADQMNNRIRMVNPAGVITTVVGSGSYGYSGDGSAASSAELSHPAGTVLDSFGNLYIADRNNHLVRKVDVSDPPSLTFAITNVGSVSASQDVAVENLGNAPLNVSQISAAANFTLGGSDTSCNSTGQLLNPAASCVLGIQFAPQSSGSISGGVVLTDNAPSTSQTISLSGTGNSLVVPTITWATPAAITYGTPLSATQLNAGSSTDGTFAYSPALGSVLSAGPQILSLTFTPTDTTNYTTATASVTLTVNQANASVTANPAAKVYGAAEPSLSGTLSGFLPGDGVTATYSRTAGETVVGSPYAISATLSPANALANYNITSNPAQFTITKALLTATAINASMVFGGTVPTLRGTLIGVVEGDGITATFTTVATSSSPAGSYPIVVLLNDPNGKLGNYDVVSTNGTLTIGAEATTTVVLASSATVLSQSSVTLTATVSAATTPSGSVSFMDGGSLLGSATLDSTGKATLTTSALSVGTHSITAVYAGNANFATSTASATTETVVDFNFAVSGTTATTLSATVMPGKTAVYVLQFAPTGASTFPSTVTLTLMGLPAGATYTITPSSIAAGSGTTTVTVTVNTAKQQTVAAALPAKDGRGFPKSFAFAAMLPLFGMLRLRRVLRTRSKTLLPLLLLLAVLMAMGMSACGGGSGFFAQAPQTYPMTLTGTSGALHHSVALNLTVQ